MKYTLAMIAMAAMPLLVSAPAEACSQFSYGCFGGTLINVPNPMLANTPYLRFYPQRGFGSTPPPLEDIESLFSLTTNGVDVAFTLEQVAGVIHVIPDEPFVAGAIYDFKVGSHCQYQGYQTSDYEVSLATLNAESPPKGLGDLAVTSIHILPAAVTPDVITSTCQDDTLSDETKVSFNVTLSEETKKWSDYFSGNYDVLIDDEIVRFTSYDTTSPNSFAGEVAIGHYCTTASGNGVQTHTMKVRRQLFGTCAEVVSATSTFVIDCNNGFDSNNPASFNVVSGGRNNVEPGTSTDMSTGTCSIVDPNFVEPVTEPGPTTQPSNVEAPEGDAAGCSGAGVVFPLITAMTFVSLVRRKRSE